MKSGFNNKTINVIIYYKNSNIVKHKVHFNFHNDSLF